MVDMGKDDEIYRRMRGARERWIDDLERRLAALEASAEPPTSAEPIECCDLLAPHDGDCWWRALTSDQSAKMHRELARLRAAAKEQL